MQTMTRGGYGVARLQLTRRSNTRAWLAHGSLQLPCAIGRGGLQALKREGDGATPVGMFALREVWYRPDRICRPLTPHPTHAIGRRDGWCDACGDRNYNRAVALPYRASTESLWRQDRLYDVVGVLDYNLAPRSQGRGSCIFLHVARPGLGPTEGCIALALDDLLRLIERPFPLLGIDTRARPNDRPLRRAAFI